MPSRKSKLANPYRHLLDCFFCFEKKICVFCLFFSSNAIYSIVYFIFTCIYCLCAALLYVALSDFAIYRARPFIYPFFVINYPDKKKKINDCHVFFLCTTLLLPCFSKFRKLYSKPTILEGCCIVL